MELEPTTRVSTEVSVRALIGSLTDRSSVVSLRQLRQQRRQPTRGLDDAVQPDHRSLLPPHSPGPGIDAISIDVSRLRLREREVEALPVPRSGGQQETAELPVGRAKGADQARHDLLDCPVGMAPGEFLGESA